MEPPELLAIDLGLRTGFAVYTADGRLRRYASQNFGAASRLRRGAGSILRQYPNLSHLVLEGGGQIAEIWQRAAAQLQLNVLQIGAERWRQRLLYDRDQRHGTQAKATADELARRIITWSHAPRPTSLRHDAAEAIMIGFWAVLELGWLAEIPRELGLRQSRSG